MQCTLVLTLPGSIHLVFSCFVESTSLCLLVCTEQQEPILTCGGKDIKTKSSVFFFLLLSFAVFMSQLQLVASLNMLNHMDRNVYTAVILFPFKVQIYLQKMHYVVDVKH